jgi:hypothetical protein
MQCLWCDNPITRKQKYFRIRLHSGRIFIHKECLSNYEQSKLKGEQKCSSLRDDLRRNLDLLCSDPLGQVRRLVL